MLIDARTMPTDESVETEVCIVGAGPAGTTLAREFIGQDFRVCLLESGGTKLDDETQSLSDGKITEKLWQDLRQSRCRQLGGAANLWKDRTGENHYSVRLLPLDAIDFEQRDWLPYSGWPFKKSDLDPFYERAQHLCRLRPFAYDAQDWEDAETPPLPFTQDRIKTTMYQFGPRNVFTHEFRTEINRSANITTYTYANVVEVETKDTAGKVSRVRVASLNGNRFWVSAKLFILAMGGIENARLLLLSNQNQSAGLGNQNDLVGRFFMEHPVLRLGEFIPSHRQIFNRTALYDLRWVNNLLVMGKLAFSEELLRRKQLLNSSIMLIPRPQGFWLQGYGSKAVSSLKRLFSSSRRTQVLEALEHLSHVIKGFDEVVAYYFYERALKRKEFFYSLSKGGWSRDSNKEKRFRAFEIIMATEQAPNPDLRITLGAERDRLGLRKIQPLRWSWSELEIDSILRSQEILKEEISRAKLGQFQSWIELGEGTLPQCYGGSHHMGTTRMHIDPRQGVVNEDCRVHGISNLFVAGSSVFPTGGHANPTLTIIALAIRLADCIKEELSPKVSTATTAQSLPV